MTTEVEKTKEIWILSVFSVRIIATAASVSYYRDEMVADLIPERVKEHLVNMVACLTSVWITGVPDMRSQDHFLQSITIATEPIVRKFAEEICTFTEISMNEANEDSVWGEEQINGMTACVLNDILNGFAGIYAVEFEDPNVGQMMQIIEASHEKYREIQERWKKEKGASQLGVLQ